MPEPHDPKFCVLCLDGQHRPEPDREREHTERDLRPLTGRELSQQHKALIDAGIDPLWRLRWLRRQTDLWARPSTERQEPPK